MAKDINGIEYSYANKDELAFGTSYDPKPNLKHSQLVQYTSSSKSVNLINEQMMLYENGQ